jgi:hypothetical protein
MRNEIETVQVAESTSELPDGVSKTRQLKERGVQLALLITQVYCECYSRRPIGRRWPRGLQRSRQNAARSTQPRTPQLRSRVDPWLSGRLYVVGNAREFDRLKEGRNDN